MLPFSTRSSPRRSSFQVLSACLSARYSKPTTRFLRRTTWTQTMTRSTYGSCSGWGIRDRQGRHSISGSRRCSRNWVFDSSSTRRVKRSRRSQEIRAMKKTKKGTQERCGQCRRIARAEDRGEPPSTPCMTLATRSRKEVIDAPYPGHLSRDSKLAALPSPMLGHRRGRPQGRRREHSHKFDRQSPQSINPGEGG